MLEKSRWHAERPYNELPALPPEAEIETKAILKSCIDARSAVAELKQAAELIPNQAMLINILPLLEAKDSSAIENIVTTGDKLFQSFYKPTSTIDAATKEALHYRKALYQGFESLENKPLSASTAVQVCSMVKQGNMQIRRVPGTRIANGQTGEVIFTPPEGEQLLRDLLSNWEKFLHDDTAIDPLIRMAVAHYQFESIHPFTDGNGRTGRILNLLFLIETGLLTKPILYLSRFIIQQKNDYYRLLLAVTADQAWEEWILYMLSATTETARWTTEKIVTVNNLLSHTIDYVRETLPKIYTRELVDTIFEQPYCRIANLVDRNIAQRETASNYLHELEKIGVLESLKVGREKLFVHSKLLNLLLSDQHVFNTYQL